MQRNFVPFSLVPLNQARDSFLSTFCCRFLDYLNVKPLFNVPDLTMRVASDPGYPVTDDGYSSHLIEYVEHDSDKDGGAKRKPHTPEETGDEVCDNEPLRVAHIGDILAELRAFEGDGQLAQRRDGFVFETRWRSGHIFREFR